MAESTGRQISRQQHLVLGFRISIEDGYLYTLTVRIIPRTRMGRKVPRHSLVKSWPENVRSAYREAICLGPGERRRRSNKEDSDAVSGKFQPPLCRWTPPSATEDVFQAQGSHQSDKNKKSSGDFQHDPRTRLEQKQTAGHGNSRDELHGGLTAKIKDKPTIVSSGIGDAN